MFDIDYAVISRREMHSAAPDKASSCLVDNTDNIFHLKNDIAEHFKSVSSSCGRGYRAGAGLRDSEASNSEYRHDYRGSPVAADSAYAVLINDYTVAELKLIA